MRTFIIFASIVYIAGQAGMPEVPVILKFFVGIMLGAAFIADMRDAFGSRGNP